MVLYTGQFYALFFLTITLKLGYLAAYLLILASLIIGTPFFLVFGWLSDRIGRLKIILAGCLIAALTYFPLFAALTHYANPDLEAFSNRNPVTVTADGSTCELHIFVTPFTKFSNCDRAQDLVTKLGVSFKTESVPNSGDKVNLKIGSTTVEDFDAAKWNAAFLAGYNLSQDGVVADRFCQDQLVDDRIDPGHHGHLRHHGVRPDCGVPGRTVPDQDPLHVDVAALSHRQRAGSAACCRCSPPRLWPQPAISTTDCGIRSWSPS